MQCGPSVARVVDERAHRICHELARAGSGGSRQDRPGGGNVWIEPIVPHVPIDDDRHPVVNLVDRRAAVRIDESANRVKLSRRGDVVAGLDLGRFAEPKGVAQVICRRCECRPSAHDSPAAKDSASPRKVRRAELAYRPMTSCIFCNIAAKTTPAQILFEDAHVVAFRDVRPVAPMHALVIPKAHVSGVHQADAETIGRVVWAARNVAEQLGLAASGYRLVVNEGENGGQSVFHLHCHVVGGRPLGWPPG